MVFDLQQVPSNTLSHPMGVIIKASSLRHKFLC